MEVILLVNVEESSSKAMLAIDGIGFDWSYMAQEEASTNFALMAFSDSEACLHLLVLIYQTQDLRNLKNLNLKDMVCLFSENVSKEVKKTSDAPIIEDWVSDCDEDETVVLESLNVQKPKQADQPRKVNQNPRNNSTSWNTPMPKKLGVGFQFTPKACFVCGSFNHLIKDCDFYNKKMVQKRVLNNVKKGIGQRKVRPVWTNAMRVNHQKISNSRRNFAPTAVLTKSGFVPFNTARQRFSRKAVPVSTARPFNTVVHKPFVNVAKPRTNVFQKEHSSLRRPFLPTNRKRMTSTVGEQGINAVKSTAYWAWRPKSNDPPLSKDYTLESGEDSLQLIALMDLCTILFDKVTILEMLLLSIRRFMLKLSHVDEESSSSDFRYRRLFDFRGFCQTGEDQMKTSKINMLVDKKYPLKKYNHEENGSTCNRSKESIGI
ncbi:hypothetical protein Tco_0739289 [Tanacetum coccineum]